MSMFFEPLQAAIRRALELDPDSRERIRALEGRTIEVVLSGLEQRVCVVIEHGEVLLTRTPERMPDLRLQGSPAAFARYVANPDRVEITDSGISIQGDIGLAQRFVGVLRQLDIDWEEWASRYLGDVMAHRAGRLAGSLRDWAANSRQQFKEDVTEYLQEELRLLAPRERVQRLMDDIDATRSDVERLAQRIKRLQNTR